MEPNERLEIHLTSQPITITSVLVVNGQPIARGRFDQIQCSEPWVTTLQDIATATRVLPEPLFLSQQDKLRSSLSNLSDLRSPSDGTKPHSRDHLPNRTRFKGSVRRQDKRSVHGNAQSTTRSSSHIPMIIEGMLHPATNDGNTCSDEAPTPGFSNVPKTPLAADAVSSATTSNTSTTNSPSALEASSATAPSASTSVACATNDNFKLNTLANAPVTQPALHAQPSARSPATMVHASPDPVTTPTAITPGVIDERTGTLLKRMEKLQSLLKSIQDQDIPVRRDHNEKVNNIYHSHLCSSYIKPASLEHFGQLLGELGNVSNALGIVYGLLSWEVFRREEERLIREESLSPKWAAKRVNDKMSEQSNRRARAKDWASDGHLTTLDALTKISHFPALRERFKAAFKQIHESRADKWQAMVAKGYRVFDFEEFLRTRVQRGDIQPASTISQTEMLALASTIDPPSPPSVSGVVETRKRPAGEADEVTGKRRWEPHPDLRRSKPALHRSTTRMPMAHAINAVHMGGEVVDERQLVYCNQAETASLQTQDFSILFLGDL
ncbi:hypothetical protein MMC16_003268 [Acarospora aff. strigata]|nr:hypothetical protein [Acarospora aff. strigata]